MSSWRGVLLMGSLLFIATATLTPGRHIFSGGMRPDFWCFACGAEGAADVTLNLALFVPLGVALSLLGVSPPRALLAGLVLSMAIECAQRFGWPPDRIANATDVLTNSFGVFIGALMGWYRQTWLRPTPHVARVLTVVGALTVCSVLVFTAWALSPDTTSSASQKLATGFRVSRFPFTPGYGWYHGRVSAASVDEQSFTHVGDGPLILSGVVQQPLIGTVTLSGRDARQEFVPLLYVHGVHVSNPELMLGQEGNDARMQVKLRGHRLRFPGPRVVLPGAFAERASTDQTFTFSLTPAIWMLSSSRDQVHRSVVLPVSLSLGWTLLQTVVHVGDRIGSLVSLVWLLVLWLPIGYWSVFAGRTDSKR
ncbi:MAG: VanZ family protein, partial [Gemmatimonadaceae bacterium]